MTGMRRLIIGTDSRAFEHDYILHECSDARWCECSHRSQTAFNRGLSFSDGAYHPASPLEVLNLKH